MPERNGNKAALSFIIPFFVVILAGFGTLALLVRVGDKDVVDKHIAHNEAHDTQQDSAITRLNGVTVYNHQDIKEIKKDGRDILALLNLVLDDRGVSKVKRQAAIVAARSKVLVTDSIPVDSTHH